MKCCQDSNEGVQFRRMFLNLASQWIPCYIAQSEVLYALWQLLRQGVTVGCIVSLLCKRSLFSEMAYQPVPFPVPHPTPHPRSNCFLVSDRKRYNIMRTVNRNLHSIDFSSVLSPPEKSFWLSRPKGPCHLRTFDKYTFSVGVNMADPASQNSEVIQLTVTHRFYHTMITLQRNTQVQLFLHFTLSYRPVNKNLQSFLSVA